MTSLAQAMVPLKDLVQAKTRLAGLLRVSERRRLAQAMAEDVLSLLTGHPEIAGVTLVSGDPSAQLLAARYGADHLPEPRQAAGGLNAVVQSASNSLVNRHQGAVLWVHADLPLLSEADVSAALAAQAECSGLVVGCDRHGTGTNLLCFTVDSMPRFCFGKDSCARHMQAGQAAGLEVVRLQRPGIGLDVDEPRDLDRLLAQLAPGSHTAALLHESELGARISVALSSLTPPQLPASGAK